MEQSSSFYSCDSFAVFKKETTKYYKLTFEQNSTDLWHPHFIRKCTSYAVFKLYTNEYSLNCNLLLLLLLSYICVTRYTRTGNSVGVVITV